MKKTVMGLLLLLLVSFTTSVSFASDGPETTKVSDYENVMNVEQSTDITVVYDYPNVVTDVGKYKHFNFVKIDKEVPTFSFIVYELRKNSFINTKLTFDNYSVVLNDNKIKRFKPVPTLLRGNNYLLYSQSWNKKITNKSLFMIYRYNS